MSEFFAIPVVKAYSWLECSTRAGWGSGHSACALSLHGDADEKSKAFTTISCQTLHAALMSIDEYSENHCLKMRNNYHLLLASKWPGEKRTIGFKVLCFI
jgi:hypothetical protein